MSFRKLVVRLRSYTAATCVGCSSASSRVRNPTKPKTALTGCPSGSVIDSGIEK